MDNLSSAPAQQPEHLDREQKKQQQATKDRRRAMRERTLPWLRLAGIGVVVVGVIAGLIWIGEMQDSSIAQPSPISGEITSIDHVSGPENAQLTLIEYADFQCPACATYAPVLKQLKADYPENLRVVFRHFPLQTIHPNATPAAQAAEAASLQGKFWEYHDILFTRQNEWGREGNPKNVFLDYAQELGLNVDQFATDLESKAVKDRVNADYISGLSASVSGTPTFFLNGQPLENPRGLDAFKTLLDARLAQ